MRADDYPWAPTPEEWRQAILRWTRVNTSRKSIVKGEFAPDRNDEYLFYQTMIGA